MACKKKKHVWIVLGYSAAWFLIGVFLKTQPELFSVRTQKEATAINAMDYIIRFLGNASSQPGKQNLARKSTLMETLEKDRMERWCPNHKNVDSMGTVYIDDHHAVAVSYNILLVQKSGLQDSQLLLVATPKYPIFMSQNVLVEDLKRHVWIIPRESANGLQSYDDWAHVTSRLPWSMDFSSR